MDRRITSFELFLISFYAGDRRPYFGSIFYIRFNRHLIVEKKEKLSEKQKI